MLLSRLALCLCALLPLAACNKKPNNPPVPITDEKKGDAGIFQPQLDAINKAKGVEQTLQQDAAHTHEAIEKQESEDNSQKDEEHQ